MGYKSELQQWCKKYGISSTGTVEQLRKRLKAGGFFKKRVKKLNPRKLETKLKSLEHQCRYALQENRYRLLCDCVEYPEHPDCEKVMKCVQKSSIENLRYCS